MGHIFISYSHTDMEDAHVLAAQLQERGFEVWIDERLDHGSQWPHELQKQLDSCSAFIVIMRPLSYASEGCRASCNGRAARKNLFFPFCWWARGPALGGIHAVLRCAPRLLA